MKRERHGNGMTRTGDTLVKGTDGGGSKNEGLIREASPCKMFNELPPDQGD